MGDSIVCHLPGGENACSSCLFRRSGWDFIHSALPTYLLDTYIAALIGLDGRLFGCLSRRVYGGFELGMVDR